jgi:cation transport regulator
MPYRSIRELPPTVRDSLPQQAQAVYREAFNIAWEQCTEEEAAREGIAHRFAWKSAIKNRIGIVESGGGGAPPH